MNTAPYHISAKRLLLAWYLDLLFFMASWKIFVYLLNLDKNALFWAPYLLFICIKIISGFYNNPIGGFLLGIEKETHTVNPKIFERENWLTILLGVLLIVKGTKQLTKWTHMVVPQPVFGFFPDETTQILIHVVLGLSYLLAGYWFLKLDIKGLHLAIALALTTIISNIISWNLWDPVIEKIILARKAIHGLPVQDSEVESMQAIFPGVILLAAGIAIIAMLFTCKKFHSANKTTAPERRWHTQTGCIKPYTTSNVAK